MSLDFDHARFAMIEQQIRPWEVLDPRVLEALASVRREDFVPAAQRNLAFADVGLPLGDGETMMKPVVEGRTLQALDLEAGDEVLEIGTGTGYLTACLSRLARAVTSIDIRADYVEAARGRLAAAGCGNVDLAVADALAYAPGRQFDAVCVTGAVATVPAHFVEWLRPGGRLFVVEGRSPAMEALRIVRTASGSQRESLFETDLPYLRGAAPVPTFTL
ncbi:protein-L-isoaspartate O-methyltransferase family protein [Coralloluteibacterium thermophilus]|uniref:Protein-L-isoaspartate O-methyltransferase n=1 Tax=Coralloluteibacterium thermophilum TaxID=2707049 RepID=A0ABV9NI17_9GAMM